jgi:hypothetical protein
MKDKVENHVVYREPGRYAGWPANAGIWSWGDEIVTGFSLGHMRPSETGMHPIDRERPTIRMQARSLDGGATWALEEVFASTSLPGGESLGGEGVEPVAYPGGVNFEDPDFALTFDRSSLSDGAVSWFSPPLTGVARGAGPTHSPRLNCVELPPEPITWLPGQRK